MSQILANAGAVTLTKTWMVDGTPTDVDDVTIGVVDGNGDVVVAAETATTNAGSGVYTYNLADQANPNQLTVTWTDTSSGDTRVDRVEVVGNWLFTESQARKFKAKDDAAAALKPLGSSSQYPDSVIADARTQITNDLESWTGRGWIPRYARVELSGDNSHALNVDEGYCRTADGYTLNRPGRFNDIAEILSVTVGGTSVNVSNVKVDGGLLRRTDASWSQGSVSDPFNVVVEYVYGQSSIVNSVDRMALLLLVDRLVPQSITDRALSVDSEYGTIRLVQPGGPQRNASRIPEVNDWVVRNSAGMFFA